MKILYLVRGLPGSGKTTFSKSICDCVYAADDYFYNENNEYKFDVNKLASAHGWCKHSVKTSMESGIDKIAVNNTFTTIREMNPYFEMAEKYGYMVHSIIIENRHNGTSVHDVPKETIDRMEKRFNLQLR